ncbi:MAG: DUF4266 domain-containing protein [Methylacidiphilales bacterium]|nr:DUF4266 domain-containing protein [Candidatus Methylacidiphilales bacterium]
MKHTIHNLLAMLTIALVIAACTPITQPSERSILARPNMNPKYRAVHDSTDDHIYFSKEGSSGGRGFSGGGCGCN